MRDDFAGLARRALRDAGYSMKAAARATQYDPAYISRVLNGKQLPSLKLATALDALLGTGGALAATVLDADERARVACSAANPSRLDAGTVDALSGVLAAYRRLDDTVRPRSVIPATLTQAKEVTRLLKDARGPHRDRLAEVASEFVQFGGWLLAQDRQDAKAVRLLNDAVDLADDVGNGTLAAQALNFRGYIARQQGRPQGVARWFAAAAHTPGAHPAQRLGDMLQAAAGLAELGQRDDALRLVENAEGLADQASALPPPDTAYWLTPEFNRLNMGLANMGLRRYGDAVDHITAGLAGLPPELRDAPWTEEHRDALKRATAAQ
ncbi:helix-turn-helix transcriptional regulator [Streptomyces sp. NBC_01220]|uniref:helix-turn-helix domain-containing protein n=1 Tax=Streptomyces sp. NBC_01220 TaxID=2903781 RepID=UPI00352EABA0|nr:helix-turn-helix transcriptional regulator [Streptomyces sp. NBC_01220]